MRTLEEIAWSAGLYEGEGSCVLKQQRYAAVVIGMTDREPVEAMHRIWGGTLRGPEERGPRKKQMWFWTLHTLADIEPFLEAVISYLSPRREAKLRETVATARAWADRERPASPDCGRASQASGYRWHRQRGEPSCPRCRARARRNSAAARQRARAASGV